MKYLYCFLWSVLCPLYCFSQTLIWQEDFNSQNGKGVSGDGAGGIITDFSGVNWTLDYSKCSFSATDDFVKVVSKKFTAMDCNGEAVWESESIDISNFKDIAISISIGETGSSKNKTKKYIKLYTLVDGVETPFSTNANGSGNFGKLTGKTNLKSGKELKIRIKLRSDFAQKVYFDNIKVSGISNTPSADNNSLIKAPSIPNKTTSISPNETIEVLRFTIQDKGGDALPTRVTKLIIVPTKDNEIRWKKLVKKSLFSVNGNTISPTIKCTDTAITIDFSTNPLLVLEGKSTDCSLSIQLAKTSIIEGKKLAFQISAKQHKATTSPTNSSHFAEDFGTAILSNIIFTKVEASKIVILKQPKKEKVGSPISTPIIAQLQDDYGNIDSDNTLTATLSTAKGSGTFNPNSALSKTPNKGIYKWENISYNRAEKAKFKVTAGTLSTTTKTIDFTAVATSLISKGQQLRNDTISALRTTPLQSKNFFHFRIEDQGDDGLPTLVEEIIFAKSIAFSTSRIYNLIGGISVVQNGKIIGKIDKLTSANAQSKLKIPLKNTLTIPDGASAEITVKFFLNSHKPIKDKAQIQIEIPQKHKWKTSSKGSQLVGSLASAIISPIFTVEVVATKIKFEEIPQQISANTPFSLSLIAVDENGNIDTDYNGQITLSRESGKGILTSKNTLTVQFVKGKATFSELNYNTGEFFTISATSPDFASIETPPINANDTDSEIIQSTKAIPQSSLSSTISSENTAQKVFAFAIKDKATNDSNSTVITQVVLQNAHPKNGAHWLHTIAGAVLFQNDKIIATTNKISNETITFSNRKGLASIANGTTENFSLAIFLKHNNIKDNSIFQCKISAKNTAFKTAVSSSKLQKLETDLVSNLTNIVVDATQLDFSNTPFALDTAEKQFSATLLARDSNGNIDTDFNQKITLEYNDNSSATNAINGIAIFSNLQRTDENNLNLTAKSNNIKDTKHQIISGKKLVKWTEDFESGTLQNWNISSDWKTTTIAPLSGKFSLKHNLIQSTGTSIISKKIANITLENGTTIWRFQMKNGNWNPSSSNYFYYVLAGENEDLTTGISYAVGVDKSTSNDLLTLWKIENEQVSPLIISKMNWAKNNSAGIQVKLDSKGNWQLFYDNNGGFDNLYLTGTAQEKPNLPSTLFSGFIFHNETASNAGLFWADDIEIQHFSTAPQVVDLQVISATKLSIIFSQKMDKSSAESTDNYKIEKDIKIKKVMLTEGNKANITTSKLSTANYKIRLKNLQNKNKIVMPDTLLKFSYFEEAQKGDIVLNELMLDPTPKVELPDYEYIELYNSTDKPFILTNWKISVGTTEKTLPTDTILPKEYLVICSEKAMKPLSKYGKTVIIKDFPTLPNTKGTVTLKNANGIIIDKVSYQKAWYNDTDKNKGGFSLERIDAQAPTNSRANWSASYDKRGGTPCEKNSVMGIILDDTPPMIKNSTPTSRKQLKISFNEQIDTLSIKNTKFFFVNGIGYPHNILISKEGTELLLNFKENFEYGTTYEITIKEVVDVFGNISTNLSSTFGLPELIQPNEIIINEILFNPVSDNVDYVELYNRSNKIFDLATLFIATRDKNFKLKTIYKISETSKLLQPNDFLVITTNPDLVEEQYTVKNPSAMLKMKSLPSFPNDKGIIVILNQENTIIDEFHYNEKMHSKLLYKNDGVSLERIFYDLPTQNPNNWHSATESAGFGTPTYQNSSHRTDKTVDTTISISPKVFSPNGDGLDDTMQIHYQFENIGNIASVSIFDSMGRLTLSLAHNLTLDTKGIITWDGTNANGERAKTGRYIILIEIFDENGNTKTYKKTCVLHSFFK
ncbi:MAG: lamin tail domain-containing protein [Flavobacteriaceae bacterium]|nr:lamin tail domain-containing protein [Flavobacteriaceae bacterium]